MIRVKGNEDFIERRHKNSRDTKKLECQTKRSSRETNRRSRETE